MAGVGVPGETGLAAVPVGCAGAGVPGAGRGLDHAPAHPTIIDAATAQTTGRSGKPELPFMWSNLG